ncbi:AAA family ATPase [Rhodoblastus sp.]|uniref:AAA family ATPase n=1 Tax=Rhodoblastus sp. TaxID=1962975 RepID=UPI003F96ADC6
MSLMQKSRQKSIAAAPSIPVNATYTSGDGKPGKGADALARHFLQLLIEDAGGRPRKKANKNVETMENDDETLRLLADLDDEDDEHADEPPVHLSVDIAAAAVRLARAVEPEIGLVRALRKEAPVVVIETGDASVNDEVERVLKVCVLGHAIEAYGPTHFERAVPKRRNSRAVAIFERSSVLTARETNDWGKRVGHALQARYPIVGIAADAATQLPKDLLRIEDYRLSLDPLGASGIALVIGAVTGDAPSAPMDEDFARHCDLSDLRISIHADRGADGSQDKLIEVIKRRLALSDLDPRVEDLFGYGEAKEVALAIVADLKDYREGKIPWSAVGRGLLLSGPPGTGKTTLAKATAKSAGLPLVVGSLAQWQASKDGHLGHCLAAMRESFAEAKRKAPCIFLVDELDSFGDRSSFTANHRDYSTQVVNAFLELLDGAGGRQGVVVVGATNHVARIDPAITRAGRLDRTVEIPLPDIDALEKILRFHLKGDLDEINVTPAAIAARGGTGADCEAWVRRARGAARRADREFAFDDLIAAIREGRSDLPEDLRERIATHEAGHAVVAMALSLDEPRAVSLHDWGGMTEFFRERRAMTGHDVIKVIAQMLAGREAESQVYGDFTAGAGGSADSDLARATKLAAAYEGSFGLGSLGPLWLGHPDELLDVVRLSAIGPRIAKLLRHAGEQARRALSENRGSLDRLRQALVEASYLDATQIRKAVGKIRVIEIEPLPEKLDATDGAGSDAAPHDEHLGG